MVINQIVTNLTAKNVIKYIDANLVIKLDGSSALCNNDCIKDTLFIQVCIIQRMLRCVY